VKLITRIRKNMKPKFRSLWDRLMLRKRYIIETIFDQLKNISQIADTRHRSPIKFIVHLLKWFDYLYLSTQETSHQNYPF